jgi:hypothetical protein
VSDVPRVLTSTDGTISGAAQIGRTVYVGGRFSQVDVVSRSLVLVDGAGQVDPAALPTVNGRVTRAVSDGRGGVLVIGEFTLIGNVPIEGVAHLLPDGSLDRTFRVSPDGPISDIAVAHGRIYLAGGFTRINGEPRRGFAALDAGTGRVSAWGTSVAPGYVYPGGLAFSSTSVYVTNGGRLWGLDAGSGAVRFTRSLSVGALAATSQRVFVVTGGPNRVVGLDPATGDEDGWTLPFGLRYIPATYGWDGTFVSHLIVDGGRLFMAGRFDPDDGGFDNLAVLDTDSAERLPWPGVNGQRIDGFVIVGDVVVLSLQYSDRPELRDRLTGAILPFAAPVMGQVQAVVPIARGILLAGTFGVGGGTARRSMAAIDLDTGTVTPWQARDLPGPFGVQQVATDGTWLFVTHDTFGQVPASAPGVDFHKIDPATGESVAVVAPPQPTTYVRLFVAGDRIFTATNTPTNQWVVWTLDVMSWTFVPSGVTVDGPVLGFAASGDRVYLYGQFTAVNGVARRGLAAVDRASGALLPWDPAPQGRVTAAAADATRVWVAGDFQAIGGQRRRGLAELDASTAQATAWNPDAPSGFRASGGLQFIHSLVRAVDGTLLGFVSGSPPSVSGQLVPSVVAFGPDGRRLPWSTAGLPSLLPFAMTVTADCVVPVAAFDVRCHTPGIAPPSSLGVSQAGAAVTLTWAPAAGQTVTGWRLEVGRSEGRTDVAVLDLPATQTSIAAPVPAGGYSARVRAVTAAGVSIATADVSFAVGQPAAPLDVTAVVEARTVTLRWQPPTTGVPASYFFEAGPSQGASGLGLVLPGAATSHALDVPPGEYWGRLYAVTTGVRSVASSEVRIDVDYTQPACIGPPAAPINLRAQPSAGRVVLLWDLAPGDILPFFWFVSAGSTPGGSEVGQFPLPGGVLGISAAVPRGTYYVRVSASTWCGRGADSVELRVDVP